jgi:hypothetical protein
VNSSQARVPPSLAGFGWVGIVESARGPRGPVSSPGSRPPGERSPWSPTHFHTEYRPELSDWPRSLENFRSGPPSLSASDGRDEADWLRPGSEESHSLPGAGSVEPPSAEHRLGTCPKRLPQYFAAECWVTEYLATSTWPRWATRDELRGLAR